MQQNQAEQLPLKIIHGSYHRCESSSGAAFLKGSEEVTDSSKAVANLQMLQNRKTSKSNLSDGLLFSGQIRRGRELKGFPSLLREVALGEGREARSRSLPVLALGLLLCQL